MAHLRKGLATSFRCRDSFWLPRERPQRIDKIAKCLSWHFGPHAGEGVQSMRDFFKEVIRQFRAPVATLSLPAAN